MYMILFVLDDPALLGAVLDSWEAAGVGGATIVESSGLHRRKQRVPMRYAFDVGYEEEGHTTLIAIVASEHLVHACLEATQRIVGDLAVPNTGVFAAWPLAVTKGVPGGEPRA